MSSGGGFIIFILVAGGGAAAYWWYTYEDQPDDQKKEDNDEVDTIQLDPTEVRNNRPGPAPVTMTVGYGPEVIERNKNDLGTTTSSTPTTSTVTKTTINTTEVTTNTAGSASGSVAITDNNYCDLNRCDPITRARAQMEYDRYKQPWSVFVSQRPEFGPCKNFIYKSHGQDWWDTNFTGGVTCPK